MAHFPSMVLMFYFDFPLGALCLHWHRHLFWSFLLPTSLQCVSRLCLSFYAQLCSSFFPMSHRCYCMCLSCFFLFSLVPWFCISSYSSWFWYMFVFSILNMDDLVCCHLPVMWPLPGSTSMITSVSLKDTLILCTCILPHPLHAGYISTSVNDYAFKKIIMNKQYSVK